MSEGVDGRPTRVDDLRRRLVSWNRDVDAPTPAAGPSWSLKVICRTAEVPAKSCTRKPGPCSPTRSTRLPRSRGWLEQHRRVVRLCTGLALAVAPGLGCKRIDPGRLHLRRERRTARGKPKANGRLVARVQALWMEVKEQRDVAWDHVRAHRGHRWNERWSPRRPSRPR